MASAALARAKKLLRARHRREQGLFLAEGPHVVFEALYAGAEVMEVFASDEARATGAEWARQADSARVPVRVVDPRDLAGIADTRTPQGVIAVVRIPEPVQPFATGGVWLVLDGIQDPGNVGTLLRAADAFGLAGVVGLTGTADFWSGKVVRAAQGAHFRVPLLGAEDPAALLDALAARSGVLWAGDLDGDDVYATGTPPPLVALALGSEAHGIRAPLLAGADRRVRIPQPGRADSLNVAMAGSILLSWMTHSVDLP